MIASMFNLLFTIAIFVAPLAGEAQQPARVPRIGVPARERAVGADQRDYSTNYYESFRRSAGYVDKVLKGAKPGELSIEQVDRFHLVINLTTAKALALTVPASLRLRADQLLD